MLELHRKVFSEAWPDIAGQYREVEIDAFPGDLPPHHSDVPILMSQFGDELAERTSPHSPPADAAVAVELAIWAHMELVAIHPFQEGNGRTARLMMDAIIMRYVTTPTRELVTLEEDRERYLRCVKDHRRGQHAPFADFIADLLERLLDEEERREEELPMWRRRLRWTRGRSWL